ncbi:MAG TPA: class I SAM-dependent methyltransferase [Actinomycetota bacterium]|nr:class I SAM-dependent methyltransferase [Actinomycetota bacterium]
MSGSVRFDRAASFYDRTRAISPQAQARLVELLSQELSGRGPCLEIGVGTGRIALPLHRAGIEMIGVDVSGPMLEQLARNAGGDRPFPLAVADAERLPLRDQSVGAASAFHVLHLIPNWRSVVDELVRVVRPGGTVLIDPGGVHDEPDELERVFREAAGIVDRNIGLKRIADLDEAFADAGASVRELEPVVDPRTTTANRRMDAWEQNIFSFTWRLTDEVRMQAVEAARAWAREHLDDPDEVVERPWVIRVRAYRLP